MVDRETAINTAKSFVNECRLNGLKFYKVFLFGSFAKNNVRDWSDIDLLLVSDHFTDNIFDNIKLFAKANIKFPIIEAHPYPTSYYLSEDDFIKDVEKESIIIT